MTRIDPKEHMRRAIELGVRAVEAGHGGPFGAVVVRGGRILGEGGNRVIVDADPTAHAEVVAIREACRTVGDYHLQGAELYASCEPCPMCLAALHWARIGRVFYASPREAAAEAGFDDAHIAKQLTVPPDERALPMVRLRCPEAQTPFEAWSAKPDRQTY